MRFDQRFCARTAVTAGLFAAAVSVFGLSPVHAQTTPAVPPAAQPAVVRMNVDDAVATALEQNLDLQVQRINPQIRDLDTAVFKANYTPNFTTNIDFVDQTQPPSSLLAGNTSQLTNGRNAYNFGIQQQTPWYGGQYQVLFNNGRTTTNNVFTSFDPQLTSNISATYTQPLLRNFKIDGTRQQLLVSQKNYEISQTQLKQSITQTTRTVRNAFYDLQYAIGNLNVQRQSLRAVAAVAQGQSRPRRDRHHGAARHRAGRGRSGDARGSGDRRRGGDRAAAGSAPRADFRTRRRPRCGTRASSRAKPTCLRRRRSIPMPR